MPAWKHIYALDAYHDTGLTPKEIMQMQTELQKYRQAEAGICNGCKFEKTRRQYILPCTECSRNCKDYFKAALDAKKAKED